MIKYEREENGVKVSLQIDNENYTSKEVTQIIEQINTTVEVKEIKEEKHSFTDFYKGDKDD